ncbi:transmembrane protein 232-like [Saccoglossus kowalevskii]
MPITRVPIVHKFGIISQSQREELQERLMKQAFKQGVSSDNRRTTRNPLDITDDFISQYNSASTHDEKKRVDDIATKMISRSRRRAGIKDGGHGNHVDLPRAWSELSILAQCQGKVQEEALDILITSLDQAPVIRGHIPSLFFLAETTLYWLRTDAMTQPYLRSGEIKLLKMGHLVFTRLFYHHMSGHLHGHSEFKNRLVAYLEGFSDCQEAYSPYPGAHLSLRYISEVGKMIIGDHKADPGEIKEADKIADEQAALLGKRSLISIRERPVSRAVFMI